MADLKIYEEKMEKTVSVLKEEFNTIRVGRANPHVLDKIRVDYYGMPSPIQSVANISGLLFIVTMSAYTPLASPLA